MLIQFQLNYCGFCEQDIAPQYAGFLHGMMLLPMFLCQIRKWYFFYPYSNKFWLTFFINRDIKFSWNIGGHNQHNWNWLFRTMVGIFPSILNCHRRALFPGNHILEPVCYRGTSLLKWKSNILVSFHSLA